MSAKFLVSLLLIVFLFSCTKKEHNELTTGYKSAQDEYERLINTLSAKRYMINSICDSVGNRLLKYDCALDDTIRFTGYPNWNVNISMGKNWCGVVHSEVIFDWGAFVFVYDDSDVSIQFPSFAKSPSDSTTYQENDSIFYYKPIWFNRLDDPNRNYYNLDSLGNLTLVVKTRSTKEFYYFKPFR
jgi:hypothetical protein